MNNGTSKRDILASQPRISPAPNKVWRYSVKHKEWYQVPLIDVPEHKPTLTQKLSQTMERVALYARLVPYFIQLTYGVVLKNWKTTVTAVIGAIAMILNATGVVELSTEFQMAVVTVVMTILGFLAADGSNKDGN
jgi:hypothetical protein